jgi:hypothetical protein
MMRRPLWLVAGAALGAGGTVWAERYLRRRVRRVVSLLPARRGGGLLRAAGGRLRAAVEAGRTERVRRESELWSQLGREPEDRIARRGAGVRQGAAPTRSTRSVRPAGAVTSAGAVR